MCDPSNLLSILHLRSKPRPEPVPRQRQWTGRFVRKADSCSWEMGVFFWTNDSQHHLLELKRFISIYIRNQSFEFQENKMSLAGQNEIQLISDSLPCSFQMKQTKHAKKDDGDYDREISKARHGNGCVGHLCMTLGEGRFISTEFLTQKIIIA